jgi:hypothetical protein
MYKSIIPKKLTMNEHISNQTKSQRKRFLQIVLIYLLFYWICLIV